MFVEVIALNREDVKNAQIGGASRIELVSDMEADGLSPTLATIQDVMNCATIPVRVMVRFHNRGFVYSEQEIAEICRWIKQVAKLGVEGFVVGALTQTGEIDIAFLQAVRQVTGTKKITFHRAFDRLTQEQQLKAVPILKLHGIDAILTSGGLEYPIEQNLAHLELLAIAAHPMHILLGGGVTADVVAQLKKYPMLTHIHVGSAVREEGDFSKPVSTTLVRNLSQ